MSFSKVGLNTVGISSESIDKRGDGGGIIGVKESGVKADKGECERFE